jgi:hypothetical protein
MQTQTTYLGTPEDLEAALSRVIAPLEQRLRELEITAGSDKHLYTVTDVAQRTGYGKDTIRKFITQGVIDRKHRLTFLKAKEITKGDYRITPAQLDEFVSHF